MIKLTSRTPVLCADSDRVLFYAHREHATRLVAEGTAKLDSGMLRITGRTVIDVNPGSFGVHKQHCEVGNSYGLSGGIVFSHKRTYEGLSA